MAKPAPLPHFPEQVIGTYAEVLASRIRQSHARLEQAKEPLGAPLLETEELERRAKMVTAQVAQPLAVECGCSVAAVYSVLLGPEAHAANVAKAVKAVRARHPQMPPAHIATVCGCSQAAVLRALA